MLLEVAVTLSSLSIACSTVAPVFSAVLWAISAASLIAWDFSILAVISLANLITLITLPAGLRMGL